MVKCTNKPFGNPCNYIWDYQKRVKFETQIVTCPRCGRRIYKHKGIKNYKEHKEDKNQL